MSWQLADPADRFRGRGYDVTPIGFTAARDFIAEHHYLKSIGADVKRYGLWRRGELVGVAVYGIPSNPRVITNWLPDLAPVPRGDGTYHWPALSLLRLSIIDLVGGNGESWFVARCRELLTADGVLATVTFADPMALWAADGRLVFRGHAGILYQGDNWTYCGLATARPVLITPAGERLDERRLQKIRKQEPGHQAAQRFLTSLGAKPIRPGEPPAAYLRRALNAIGVRRIRHTGCHRYIRPHRRDVAVVHRGRRIRRDPRAYPKLRDDLFTAMRVSPTSA